MDGLLDSNSATPSALSEGSYAQQSHPRYLPRAAERILTQVSDWLQREKTKKEHKKSRRQPRPRLESVTNRTASPPAGDRASNDSATSDSSGASLDQLQKILDDNMAALSLKPGAGPRLTRKRSRRSSKSLAKTASSDTEWVDDDVVVPSCEATLDNSKALAYTGGQSSADDSASVPGRREKDRQNWITFKNEIIRMAHTLGLKGWRRVPLNSGETISVERLSGALTNAVYVVSPPPESVLPRERGKSQPTKVLLRIYGPQVEHLIDREAELNVLRRLARKKIGPRLLGTFLNGRFEQYLNATPLTPTAMRDPGTSNQIAKRMRELHDGVELLEEERDQGPAVWKNWDKWLSKVEKTVQFLDNEVAARPQALPGGVWKTRGFVCGVPWPVFKALVEKYRKHLNAYYGDAKTIREKLVFAHNDTQYGNILRFRPDDHKSPLLHPANEHKQLVVIDFEYAAANVPGLEFANHFSEWTYNYHDPDRSYACDTSRYPTPEEQHRFVRAYVEHRPQFPYVSSSASAAAKTCETPADGSEAAAAAAGQQPNGNEPIPSSSGAGEFDLDAPVPPGGWKEEERRREEEVERRVKALVDEARLWRTANSAQWVAWGIVQAKVHEMEGEKQGQQQEEQENREEGKKEEREEAEDEDEEEEEFDYLSYAQERAYFFLGDYAASVILAWCHPFPKEPSEDFAEEETEDPPNGYKPTRPPPVTPQEMEEPGVHFVCRDCFNSAVWAGIAEECIFCEEDEEHDRVERWIYNAAAGVYEFEDEWDTTQVAEMTVNGEGESEGEASASVAHSHGPSVIVEGPLRRVSDVPSWPALSEPDWRLSAMNPAMATDFRDELARLDGVITPGVDNTPYIQYAIEALTRGRDTDSGLPDPSSGSGSSSSGLILNPNPAMVPSSSPGQQQQRPPPAGTLPSRPVAAHPPATEPAQPDPNAQPLPLPVIPGPRESAHSLAETLLKKGPRPQPHEWRPVSDDELVSNGRALPPLTFRPWPLRPLPLFGLMTVCVLMIGALIFCAVFSHLRQGLAPWGGLYGGFYFVFRFLPQLVAAGVLLYAQFVVATMLRTLPFARLAAETPEEREGALFQDMYPSFLWPRLVGPWKAWVPVIVTWLMSFTVPLQSSLFTVILVDQTWTWATVQGVAWTLVALYLALLASTVLVWRYWAGIENTGLVWDPRSLADVAALVSETNTAEDYRGTQLARSRDGIRFALRRRTADRLCYWTWKDGRHGIWHTLGSPMDEPNLMPLRGLTAAGGERMQRFDEKKKAAGPAGVPLLHNNPDADHSRDPDHDIEHAARAPRPYLPFPFRTSPLLWFVLIALAIVIAIFVATFHPATRLSAGFPPQIPAAPRPGAFSPADFVFSFVPSLIGVFVFLAFQSLDLHLRILQPWASLSDPRGAPAHQSILADYAACAPGQVTLHALRNRHWHVAAVSLLSALFVLIPVLAGGCFMALTVTGGNIAGAKEGEVRMYANTPAYGILLGLLVLYVAGLAALLPRRAAMRMPHPVTCLAEVVGYLVAAEMREEPAFKRCVARSELTARLGVGKGLPSESQSWWAFGFGDGVGGGGGGPVSSGGSGRPSGESGDMELGVRRVRRFTERVRKSQIRRPKLG
ncbi:hypothetical protein VTJ49DRAFT_7697 [Mycothermus thermophilus]|uniref:Choline kinase N-terminal domain-containing protein n=1 Tax=Humicola insolens TaxID=85995 RepID=A0ABR3VG74_HUMIN